MNDPVPIKNLGGRPLKWTDPDSFANAVDTYFETEPTPTWSGLALYLGFSSRDSLNDYKKKDGFSDPIKKALLQIEKNYESNLFGRNPAGSIFALKNFGWRDKQEMDIKHEGEWTISMNINGGNKVQKALDAGLSDQDN